MYVTDVRPYVQFVVVGITRADSKPNNFFPIFIGTSVVRFPQYNIYPVAMIGGMASGRLRVMFMQQKHQITAELKA